MSNPSRPPRSAWPIMAFYFLSFIAAGIYMPYLQLYFRRIGLTGTQIGTLTAVMPFVGLLLPLAWGVLADLTRAQHRLLSLAVAASTLSFMAFPLVKGFGPLLAVNMLFAAFNSPIGPLTTSVLFDHLERFGGDYGRIRVWGSVGYGLAVWLSGRTIQATSLHSMFYGYGLFAGLALMASLWLPHPEGRPIGRQIGQEAVQLLHRPSFLLFLACAFGWRIFTSVYYTFFTIYLDALGASEGLIGIAWGTALVGEILIIRFSGAILERMGVVRFYALGLLGTALRWAVYGFIRAPAAIIPFQVLHGLTYGATATATVIYAERSVSSELRASAQGLLHSVMWGLGGVIGSLLVGPLYDLIGVQNLFRISSIGALFIGLVILLWVREPSGGEDILEGGKRT